MAWNYTDLWNGSILGGIAHAIAVAKMPDISNEQSWDGRNYSVQDSQGSRATISFGEKGLVCSIFWLPSFRAVDTGKISYPLEQAFAGLPTELNKLAYDESSQYLLQEVDGVAQPVLTAAFWALITDAEASSADQWKTVMKHGGALIELQQMPVAEAIQRWSEQYDFPRKQIDALQNLFEIRHRDLDSEIKLDPELSAYLKDLPTNCTLGDRLLLQN